MKRSANITYKETAKLQSLLRNQVECQSRSFWLLSTLIHMINQNGFVPQEPGLFQDLISALTTSLVNSTQMVGNSFNFVQFKRREGILFHMPPHVAACHKQHLLSSPLAEKCLFGSQELSRVLSEAKWLGLPRRVSDPVLVGPLSRGSSVLVCRGSSFVGGLSVDSIPRPYVLGWGANLPDQFASGTWSKEESLLSINARELLAVEKGLLHFAEVLSQKNVALFCDNTTAISYLRRQGGTHSPLLNSIAQRILRWAEGMGISLMPQFVLGIHNVVADALSRPGQIVGCEWSLSQEVFVDLRKRWPVTIDLFATSLNRKCCVYFPTVWDPMAAGVMPCSSHGTSCRLTPSLPLRCSVWF